MNTNSKFLILLLGIATLCSHTLCDSISTNIYVSGIDGDDDNDGLSETSPFKTLARAQQMAFILSMVH